MKKTIAIYAVAIAAAAAALQWLEYQYAVRVFSTEIYIVIIAAAFTALGAWAGYKLTNRAAPAPFEINAKALASLGVSEREYQVLELLADGQTNKEIAATLYVSPNTVKTHLARLYEKLDVSRRTQAIQKAKTLGLIR